MNILCIVLYWPSLFEENIYREMEWMRTRGHNLSVLALADDTSGRHVDLARFSLDRVPLLKIDAGKAPKDQVVSEALAFAQQQGTQLIDAVFAREPAEVACRMHRAGGLPFVVRMRGGDAHSNTSPILREILEHASVVAPPSQFIADVLVGKRKVRKTPNGIPADISPRKLRVLPFNLPARYLSKAPVRQHDDVQVVGSIGRLVPIKRYEDLIEAVAGLAVDFPKLRLLLIGGGVMEPQLKDLAERVGIGERLEITGFLPWDEVMAQAARLHIYVQPSELEGFCLSTVEAAFKGMPLVLSRTGVHEECVNPGGNGYLFDAGDVSTLRRHLRRLLRAGAKEREKMGANTLAAVGSRFVSELAMPRIESILQAAVAGAAPPP